MQQLIELDDITAAASRIGGHVLRTPTIQSHGLRSHLGVPVELKLELLQYTGSFKPRGAFNKILGLSDQERSVGVVAVSGGNHGVAVAEVAGLLGITAVVVMPDYAPPVHCPGPRGRRERPADSRDARGLSAARRSGRGRTDPSASVR